MPTEYEEPKLLPAFVPVIRALMKQHGIKRETELARAINVPQPTINRILSGQVSDPHISTLSTLAKYFNVTIDQIIGNAPMNSTNSQTANITTLPIIPWEKATQSENFLTTLTPQNWQEWTTINLDVSTQSYALISKPSMSPRFPTNALLIIDPSCEPRDGDFVIVHYDGTDQATIRHITIDGRIRTLGTVSGQTAPEPITEEHNLLGTLIQTRFSYR